jgi:hypothetical protein
MPQWRTWYSISLIPSGFTWPERPPPGMLVGAKEHLADAPLAIAGCPPDSSAMVPLHAAQSFAAGHRWRPAGCGSLGHCRKGFSMNTCLPA